MRTVLLLLTCIWSACAQLPVSGTLSERDWPLFRAEVARIESVLPTAADKNSLTYEMARTWAAAKQWPETVQWLRKVADMKAGLDPSRDCMFAPIWGTTEFAEIMAAVRDATPPVLRSVPAFRVAEGDLVPESIAYDRKAKSFYLGSTTKAKVVRCSAAGVCSDFAAAPGKVLGLKAQGGSLWILSNADGESALICFDIASGGIKGKYVVTGAGHEFNDLVIAPGGDVFLTDTPASTVWHLERGGASLVRMPGRFPSANGITLSPRGDVLYVSTFPDGIDVVDLRTNAITPIRRPGDLCLASIDGLYYFHGRLIAIQNSIMTPRVVRLMLSRDGRTIRRFEVMERRNPLFDGITTGVVVGAEFFYMANMQDEKKDGFDPITVLRIRL